MLLARVARGRGVRIRYTNYKSVMSRLAAACEDQAKDLSKQRVTDFSGTAGFGGAI